MNGRGGHVIIEDARVEAMTREVRAKGGEGRGKPELKLE